MKMLEVNELKKTYQDFSMEHISFSVDQGKIAGFIGVNGSGKTTTIRMLLNLIKTKKPVMMFRSSSLRLWPSKSISPLHGL